MLQVTTHVGRKGLQELEIPWNCLYSQLQAPSIFQEHSFFRCFVESLCSTPDNWYFFVLRADSFPVGIIPLYWEFQLCSRVVRLRALSSLKHAHVSFSNILLLPSHSLSAFRDPFLRAVCSACLRWDALIFADIPNGDALAADLKTFRRGPVHYERVSNFDILPCSTSYENIQANYSKNFRGALRKARNKLKELSGVQFKQARTRDDLPTAFNHFLDVEASGWKGAQGTAIKLTPQLVTFYKSLMLNSNSMNQCEINLLMHEDACMAAQFCLLSNHTRYILKIGYDETCSKVAPGNMLLEHVLDQTCKDDQFSSINLITDAKWHDDWKPERIPLYRVCLYNSTPRGRLAYLVKHFSDYVRACRKPLSS